MMRRALALTTALALTFGASTVQAQAPSFAGTWTMVADPAAPPAPGRGGFGGLGQTVIIAQDAKTLTTTQTTQMGEVKSVYNLDGSESKNTMTMGGNAVERSSVAKWDGKKLVITTTANFNGNANTSTMALSLDAGGNLVVESTRAGRGGGAPVTTTTTYKKS